MERIPRHADVAALALVPQPDEFAVRVREDAVQTRVLDVMDMQDVDAIGLEQLQASVDALPDVTWRVVEPVQPVPTDLRADDDRVTPAAQGGSETSFCESVA